jgi:hypothetical protein
VDPSNPLAGFVADPALLKAIPGFVLPALERIPPTTDVEVQGSGEGFSGRVNGVADEAHTPAGLAGNSSQKSVTSQHE